MSTQLPKVARLSPLVTRVLGCNPGKFTLQGTNTYIIGSGKRRILLDTGDGTHEYESVLSKYLTDQQIEISTILLSHWHPDHVGGLNQVMQVTSNQSIKPQIYKCFNDDRDGFDHKVNDLTDRQVFEVEGATLVGYFTPGHADDHYVFWLQQEEALFSADNVLGEGTSVFNDLAVYMKSLERMLNIGELKTIYPGHGPVIKDGKDKIQTYMAHRLQRESQICDVLKQSASSELTAYDITQVMYKDLAPNVQAAAERGVVQHLQKLLGEQKVSKSGDQWKLVLNKTSSRSSSTSSGSGTKL